MRSYFPDLAGTRVWLLFTLMVTMLAVHGLVLGADGIP